MHCQGALYMDGDSEITFSGGDTMVSGNYALFQGGEGVVDVDMTCATTVLRRHLFILYEPPHLRS